MNCSDRDVGIVRALVLVAVLMASPVLAQQPSPEQVSAIRANCRSDFMSKCSGVTPGGADAIACLRKNAAQLSPGCQTAVNAIAPKPAAPAPSPVAAPPPTPAPTRTAVAPAPTPAAPAASTAAAPPAAATPVAPAAPARMTVPSADQVAAIRASCPADFAAHCAGVPAGGMEGLACLQRHAAQLSAPCRFAVTTTGAAAAPAPAAAPPPAAAPAVVPTRAPVRTAARPPAPAAATPAAAPAAAAASPPTAEQQAAIRASCRSDFMAKCSGVQPGGADALACLKRNAAQLSPACGTAVSAIGAPAAASAAPAAAPAGPTPAQQAAIKNTCRRDFMMNCRGVQPGGPEAFACLQRNSARLSLDCRTSLAAIADPGVAATPAATAAAPAPRALPPGPFPLRRAIRERMMVH